jgi:hypothetical protein
MITNFFTYFFLGFLFQDQIPYKPSEAFELKMDYIFKERSTVDQEKVVYREGLVQRKASGPMPYLFIELKILALANDEVRIRVVNSRGNLVFNRKATAGTVIKLDWGYTEDIKDKITTHEFTVFFNDQSKKSVSKILLTILDDGVFMVNEEKRGKF